MGTNMFLSPLKNNMSIFFRWRTSLVEHKKIRVTLLCTGLEQKEFHRCCGKLTSRTTCSASDAA
jgi:hypothetical protein